MFFAIGMMAMLVTVLTHLLVDNLRRGWLPLWAFMMMVLCIIFGVFLIVKMAVIIIMAARE